MKTVLGAMRGGLILWLSLQLTLPASVAAQSGGRDPVVEGPVEGFREKAALGAVADRILRGPRGSAADSSKVVRLGGLFGRVSKGVPRLTRGRHCPYGQIHGTDLPLLVANRSIPSQLIGPIDTGRAARVLPGVSSPYAPSGSRPMTVEGQSRKWLWVALGAAALGGVVVGLSRVGGGDGAPETGGVCIDMEVPWVPEARPTSLAAQR